MASSPLRNVGLKFLSICIATLLWLVVAGDRVVERALRVPIEFQNLPTGLEIVGDPPETVDVRLRGSSGALARLTPGDTAALVELRHARPGRRLFHLTASHIKVPYGIDVVQVSPATLPIGLESSAVRIVDVRPSIDGEPAAGYEIGTIRSEPATVEVVGPESSLRGLDEAMTEPVSVANATRPVQEVVTIGVADPRVRLRMPQTAVVTVPIVPGSSTRTLGRVPIEVRNVSSSLKSGVTPNAVDIVVRGSRDAIEALTASGLTALVDASGLAAGDHRVAVQVRAGPGVSVDAVRPQDVRLRLTRP